MGRITDWLNSLFETNHGLGGEAVVVSGDYEDAVMFENLSGGVGALLRW